MRPHPHALRHLLTLLTLLLPALLLTGAAQEPLFLYGGGTYAPGQSVRLDAYLASRPEAQLALYRVADPRTVLELGGPRDFRDPERLDLRPVRSVTVLRDPESYSTVVDVGALPAGLYFAQLGSGPGAGATMLLVSDLALVVKSDADTVLTYTATLQGEPRPAEIHLLRGRAPHAEARAGADGLAELPLDPAGALDSDTDAQLAVAAHHEGAWAFSDVYWQRWNAPRPRIYLVTDRPTYRPGHTVLLKGTARAAGSLAPLAGVPAEVVVFDADATELLRQELTTDEYGGFSTSVALGLGAPLGYYSVTATVAGETGYGSFQVQEYRKPEYRVTVTPAEPVAVQGGEARFTIGGEYLFGGPVAGGRVSYAVLREPYHRFEYRSAYGFYEQFGYGYGGELIARGEGVLDEAGELVISVPLEAAGTDYRLTVQAGVTDDARREISGNGSLVAYRAAVTLGLRADRYAYREGEAARLTVRAEDLAGGPAAVPFELSATRLVWVEGEGAREEPGPSTTGSTDPTGEGAVTLAFDRQGSYRLTVTARDEAGRETSAEEYLWVAGDERWYWGYGGLSITPDQEEYAPGDTARFVIESPVPDARALVTLEGAELAGYELVEFEGSVLTYELPISAGMSPNSYLGVVIVGDGRVYSEVAGFLVPPVDRFLNVEIVSDSDVYEPGGRGEFTVRVSDASGRGVRAQLTVGLVDEAIYLLSPDGAPDIRAFFYGLRGNAVGTDLSSFAYFGFAEPLAAREALDEAVFAQGKAGFAEARLREEFRDTILWLPALETGEDGLARFEAEFPDDLTEWRLTARAITAGAEVGQAEYRVRTSLPVIARLAAPRFLVRGDEAVLRVVGQSNLADEQVGQLSLEADGLLLERPGARAVSLPAGGAASADYRAGAAEPGTARLTAQALTAAASDALRLPLPVLPHGIPRELTWAGSGEASWSFELPAAEALASVEGALYLTPSLAAAVSPALAYLAGFPYGCTEQTMSRFLPSVLAAQAGALARLPEEVAADLDDFVSVGLKQIYEFQHDDGGWGFWRYDVSNPFITAYVVNGLLQAAEAGYPVREWVVTRGLDYLEGAARKETFQVHAGYAPRERRRADHDARAYAYYALARAGRDISPLGQIAGRREMSPYGLALTVLAFHQAGRDVEANLHLDELLTLVTERDAVAYWEADAPRYSWSDDRVEATAYALEALARLRPDEPLIPKVVNWLLLERRGARWVATKDTAAVVGAALALEEATGAAVGTGSVTATVTLNGRRLGEFAVPAGAADSVAVPLGELSGGGNRLELAADGPLYASASVTYLEEREFERHENRGVLVRREYEALVPRYVEAERRYVYDRVPLGTPAVGDTVLVTITLVPRGDYRYVLVNEPLPAGFAVIENDEAFRVAGLAPRYGYDYYGWNRWYDGREVRDARIDYYFTNLARPVTFTYLLRAETPGSFTALPTRAWLMYEPDVEGIGTARTLEVVAEAESGPAGEAARPAWERVGTAATDGTFTVLTGAEEDERHVPQLFAVLRAARAELEGEWGFALPEAVTVRVHPDLDSFTTHTGAPWFVAGVADRGAAAVDLQRLRVLLERGTLETTLRHELFHLAQPAGWPRWRAEGAAMIFAGEAPAAPALVGLTERDLDRLLAAPPDRETLARAAATAREWAWRELRGDPRRR